MEAQSRQEDAEVGAKKGKGPTARPALLSKRRYVTLPSRCIKIWPKTASLALYQAIKKRLAIFTDLHPMFNTLSALKMAKHPLLT